MDHELDEGVIAAGQPVGRGACHAQQGVNLRLVQAEGLVHVWRAEGLELLGWILGQDSTPHCPPTQAAEGLEAAINRGRLQLLDVEELVPVAHQVAGVEGLE